MTIMNSPAGQISLVASLLPNADHQRIHLTVRALERETFAARLPAPTSPEQETWATHIRTQLAARITTHEHLVAALAHVDRLAGQPLSGDDFHLVSHLLDRVDQQALVAKMTGLVRLANPGSQAYPRGVDGRPTHVWYASYGSNLRRARMDIYIHGGSPNAGPVVYAGARDKAPIGASVPISLPGTVHYAGHSRLWGGAVAFLDTAAPGRSLGRAHLITAEQFDDVVFQESHGALPPDGTPVDLHTTLRAGRSMTPGLYSTLVHVGDYQGFPVVTFTSPFTTSHALAANMVITAEGHLCEATGRETIRTVQAETRLLEEAAAAAEGRPARPTLEDWSVFTASPSDSYRTMIASGLTETFDLAEAQVDTYFAGATGYYTSPSACASASSIERTGLVEQVA